MLSQPVAALLKAASMYILSSEAKDVSIQTDGPPVLHTKGTPRGMPAGFREHLGPLHKGREALGKVGRFDHPVVHLDVDVRVVVALPRGDQQCVPEALQVGRDGRIARRTDLQIAGIIEVELLEFPRIALFDEPVRRQPRWLNSEIKVHALRQRLHVGNMVSLERRVAQLLRLL